MDAVREVKPPFSPESVVEEFSALLKAYHITKVVGDRYGGEWPREQFRNRGITYEVGAKPRSDLYRDVLPLINSRQAALLEQPKLITQLCSLERRTGGRGRDTIENPPSGHDDIANAVCGALDRAAAEDGRERKKRRFGWRPQYFGMSDPLAAYRV